MSDLINVFNLTKKYNSIKGETIAIDDMTFDVKQGEFVAIVGNSGCGKSTLLSILAKLLDKSSGEIKYNIDNPVIGYMLQEDALFDHLNVMDNVLLGLKILKRDTKDNRDYVLDMLKKYNLFEYKDKFPRELSGGMKQRVALIRTLAIKPDILFLDEPFSALDYSTRLKVADDVYEIIKNYGKTTIMVTHDIGEAVSMADRVIVLSKSPAKIKGIYNIKLNDKGTPTHNRNDIKFNEYIDLIWKDLDIIV